MEEYQTRLLTDKVRLVYIIHGKHAIGYMGFKLYEEYIQVMDFVQSICIQSVTLGASHWKPHPKSSLTMAFMPLDDKNGLHITYGYNHKQLKVWLEFNPDKLSPEGWSNLRCRLKQMFHFAGQSLVAHGSVAKCEIAVDVEHANFYGYDYFDVSLTSEDTGYLPQGTQKIGNVDGAHFWTIYNKAKELQENHGKLLGHERLRIEKTLKLGGKVSINDWASIPNPLSKLRVIDKSMLSGGAAKLWLAVLSHPMDKYGWTAQQVFHSLSKAQRQGVLDRIHLVTPDWWQPQAIWTEFPAALSWLEKIK